MATILSNGTVTNPCPFYTKAQLVEWACKRYKKPQSHYKKLKVNQLRAMWYAEASRPTQT